MNSSIVNIFFFGAPSFYLLKNKKSDVTEPSTLFHLLLSLFFYPQVCDDLFRYVWFRQHVPNFRKYLPMLGFLTRAALRQQCFVLIRTWVHKTLALCPSWSTSFGCCAKHILEEIRFLKHGIVTLFCDSCQKFHKKTTFAPRMVSHVQCTVDEQTQETRTESLDQYQCRMETTNRM